MGDRYIVDFWKIICGMLEVEVTDTVSGGIHRVQLSAETLFNLGRKINDTAPKEPTCPPAQNIPPIQVEFNQAILDMIGTIRDALPNLGDRQLLGEKRCSANVILNSMRR